MNKGMTMTEQNEIIVEVWARGYADESGLTRVKLPLSSTDTDIQKAVRKVGMMALLAGVRRPYNTGLTPGQTAALAQEFRGDNS